MGRLLLSAVAVEHVAGTGAVEEATLAVGDWVPAGGHWLPAAVTGDYAGTSGGSRGRATLFIEAFFCGGMPGLTESPTPVPPVLTNDWELFGLWRPWTRHPHPLPATCSTPAYIRKPPPSSILIKTGLAWPGLLRSLGGAI